jgi:hypothetical protein
MHYQKGYVVLGATGKQAHQQLVAERLRITERWWAQLHRRVREQPNAIVDSSSAPFDEAIGEEQQGRSSLKHRVNVRA